MIYSMARQIIDNSIKRQKLEQAKNRRALTYKMLDYYNGDNTEQYVKDRFSASSFQEVPISSMNITKRFVDKMSRVYTLGANRTLQSKQDVYDDLTRMKDVKLKHFEKMTKLLGTIAVHIGMDEDANGNKFFKYTPKYAFDVILDELDPFKPIAIKYPIILNTDDASVGNEVLQYAYYDDQGYIIYDDNGKELKAETHDLGVLPFVFMHKDHQQLEFTVPGAIDIINANEQLNILFTEMNLGMRFQMFGQYTVTGMYADENIQRAGSDEIIILPEGANMNILSPTVNIDDAIALAKTMLEVTASNNHLTVSFIDPQKDRPQSGTALQIRNIEYNEKYQDDLGLWIGNEMELYELEKKVANSNGIGLPNDIGIDFNEPKTIMTTPEEIAMNTWLLENNMTTKAKLLKKYNDDLTLEQAQAEIKDNESVNGTKEQQSGSIFSRVRNRTQATE